MLLFQTSAAPGGYSTSALSPGALGGRMAAELHLLDGVEESLRQITDVERVRGVTMAQQESVALAQILKVLCSSTLRVLTLIPLN